jgi:hypothetical protein
MIRNGPKKQTQEPTRSSHARSLRTQQCARPHQPAPTASLNPPKRAVLTAGTNQQNRITSAPPTSKPTHKTHAHSMGHGPTPQTPTARECGQ